MLAQNKQQLWRLLTSHWTMMGNLMRVKATRWPLFTRKTFHPRSQSALLSWWRPGTKLQQQPPLSTLMTMERSGSSCGFMLRTLTRIFILNLKMLLRFPSRVKPCSTHSSGQEFASPKTQIHPWQGWLSMARCWLNKKWMWRANHHWRDPLSEMVGHAAASSSFYPCGWSQLLSESHWVWCISLSGLVLYHWSKSSISRLLGSILPPFEGSWLLFGQWCETWW